MKSTFKNWNYPFVISLVFSSCCIFIGLTEYGRVYPEAQFSYLVGKIIIGSLGLGLAFLFYFKPPSDLSLGFFTLLSMIYTVYFMWFAPLYEFAYLQTAVACAFFRFKRTWIYPSLTFLGLLGILVTHALQSQWDWKLPPIVVADLIWISVIVFFVAFSIQRFALRVYRDEQIRLTRYTLIGRESLRLIHDLKGLLSSPLLLLEELRADKRSLSKDQLISQLALLSEDLQHVREAAKTINRFVVPATEEKSFSALSAIRTVLVLLQRRLQGIEVSLPEDFGLRGEEEKFSSIIFNLVMNSVEAFEANRGVQAPRIQISLQKHTIVYSDNAGAMTGSKTHGSGLGLLLIEEDLRDMNGTLDVVRGEGQTLVQMKLPGNRFIQVEPRDRPLE